jgi:hypothetical protein
MAKKIEYPPIKTGQVWRPKADRSRSVTIGKPSVIGGEWCAVSCRDGSTRNVHLKERTIWAQFFLEKEAK